MSAFLGPIHHWLYNKIFFQEELTKTIADYGKNLGWQELLSDDAEGLYARCVSEDRRDLEEIVDLDNIHGSLQSRIALAEGRYAELVTKLAEADEARVEDMKKAAYECGKANAMTAETTPEEAFGNLNNSLLDGMPCDNVNQLVEKREDKVVWRRNMDIHAQHWNGGDDKLYYVLRAELIAGMLEGTSLEFTSTADGEYTIAVK